jgi:spore coat protein A
MSSDENRGYDVNRRTVLKAAGAAGAVAALPWATGPVTAVTGITDENLKDDIVAERFTDELPRPGVLSPSGRNGRALHYDLKLTEFEQTVLPSALGVDTTVWGYGGSFPGPTIEAEPRMPVEVEYDIDDLPTTHLLADGVDPNVHGAEPPNPEVRISTHLHGGVVRPEDDGYPEAWASPDGTTNDQPIEYKRTKEYPNEQKPGTMWYHDHALGITRLNVYAGLAGFYLLRDPLESRLPSGDYEVPIVIQDRTFVGEDGEQYGELFYPPGDDDDYEAEFAADIPVVNGKAYPTLTVEPREYRLRWLNGSNGRTFNLRLYNEDAGSYADVPLLQQIGVDLGFLERVVEVGPGGTVGPRGPIDSLLLSGAERADTIVDFSEYAGQSFLLTNDAEFPYAGENSGPDVDSMGDIMRIEVTETPARAPDTMPLQQFLTAIDRKHPEPRVTDSGVTRTHTLTSAGFEVEDGVVYDTHFLNMALWEDETAVETPQLGTSETWEFVNLTGDSHPIHVHLVDVTVLERESFEWNAAPYDEESFNLAVEDYVNGNGPKPDFNQYVTFSGDPNPPNPNNAENKDTVLVNPLEVVRVEPAFTGYPGRYPWHCHILEHEDQEMMLPFEVQPE